MTDGASPFVVALPALKNSVCVRPTKAETVDAGTARASVEQNWPGLRLSRNSKVGVERLNLGIQGVEV